MYLGSTFEDTLDIIGSMLPRSSVYVVGHQVWASSRLSNPNFSGEI